nr:hypothetical protein [Tanacetum cinerariifolium]
MANGHVDYEGQKVLKENWKKVTVNGNETLGFDMSKVECYNFHKRGHFAREYDWSDQAKEGPNYALMAYTTSNSHSKIVDNCKKGLGYESYNVVLPPYTGNFIPPKPDLSFTGLVEFANKPEVENKHIKSSKEETKAVRKNVDAPIIKEWVSDEEERNLAQPNILKKIVKPSISKIEFVKPRQQEKSARKTVKKVEHNRQNIHRPRGNQRFSKSRN